MKKITELTETRWRTVHNKDEYGNRERSTEAYTIKRPVKSIAQGPRFGHFIVDSIAFQLAIYLVSYLVDILLASTKFSVPLNLTVDLFGSVVLLLLYPGLYAASEYLWQKTPGKFLTRTVVIDEYGNRPALRAIIFRSLLRLVPFEAFSCLNDHYSHGWHDRWATTWVVPEAELATLKKLQQEQSGS